MVKIEKIKTRKTKSSKLKIDPETEITIEYNGNEVHVIYNNKIVSMASGDWLDFCFFIKDYKVCLDRKEVEEMVHES